jgi:N-methylhydantoinase A
MLIAIEIGGTFTDLIAVDNDGRYIEMKVSSTPKDPSLGALNALNVLLNEFEVEAGEIKEVLHGSTVATNAVIQRKGPTVGLLITEGFRDVPFIQRQNRGEALYTWRFEKPQHVIARKAIAEIKERLNAKGEVLIQLDQEEAIEAVEDLLRKNREIDSLAVCFLHSYANPSHERRMEELIHKRYPDMEVCISSEILPQFREYERTSTTLLTAYMKPVVSSYLRGLEDKLAEMGVHSNVYVCRSSGGILPVSAVVKYPAEMLVSGPAAGVTGAIHISKHYGMDNMMTVDMGGTSTDVSLITGGVPEITTESSIDGLPLAMPMIDIITIGAGGGSIAWIDSGGMMRVGPQSAGADPGPACYNIGGKDPTITDALVLNGYIRKEKFIGGKMELSAEMAKKSMESLVQALKVSEHEVAENIIGITISNVAQAMRIVSVERGYDPRDYVLCVYGGAGPLFAAYLAKELNLRGCLVPESPGTFSARGLLVSDYKRDYVHSLFCRIADVSPEKIIEALDSLKEKAP